MIPTFISTLSMQLAKLEGANREGKRLLLPNVVPGALSRKIRFVEELVLKRDLIYGSSAGTALC
jgi:hypothetical protein